MIHTSSRIPHAAIKSNSQLKIIASPAVSKSFVILAALFILLFVCAYRTLDTYYLNHVTRVRDTAAETIPPSDDAVCMARYITHNSNWSSLSYISMNDNVTSGMPLSRVFSISDGPRGNSTGVVYFMVSPLDLTVQDLMVQNNCSIIMTLAQSHYCMNKKYDTQDPRCGQVILSGNFVPIHDKKDIEYDLAKIAVWSRHPIMKWWFENVPSHKWIFAKMKIMHIIVVDYFGGRKFPSVADYFNRSCNRYLKTIATIL